MEIPIFPADRQGNSADFCLIKMFIFQMCQTAKNDLSGCEILN